MLALLSQLRHKCAIGFVGGSDLAKQQEQLGTPNLPVTALFDFCFAENGLTAIRMGQPLASASFIEWLGEERYKKLVNWLLVYLAGIDLPIKRGTFVEFRLAFSASVALISSSPLLYLHSSSTIQHKLPQLVPLLTQSHPSPPF